VIKEMMEIGGMMMEIGGDQREGEDAQMDDEVLHLACKEPEEEVPDEDWEEEDEVSVGGKYFDDRSGKELETAKVEAAREEELGELERRVWKVVDTSECWDKKGKGPIPVRWVDVHKGFGVHRSRLVAKDYRPKSKVGDREGLFASTPPLEMVKLVIMQAAARSKRGEVRKVMFIDIGKAHLYAPIEGEVYVELPPERAQPGKCAKLIYTLYGMRTAASSWEKEYSGTLEAAGFRPGKASTCTFWHPERDVKVIVHGDDFIIEGKEEDLRWTQGVLEAKYIVKMRGLMGPDRGDAKVVDVLNRIIEWKDDELWYEADPRHAEKMLRDMGMDSCNASAVPGAKTDGPEGGEVELGSGQRTLYRSVVARANFLAQDRADIRFAVKELCRKCRHQPRGVGRSSRSYVATSGASPGLCRRSPSATPTRRSWTCTWTPTGAAAERRVNPPVAAACSGVECVSSSGAPRRTQWH
jgi:hypothetical protein